MSQPANMNDSFLARRSLWRIPNALLILMVVFFFIPWGLRAARQSLSKTENNVKDWLPADFRETTELAWFGRYFAGERFIIATWPGCTVEDQRLKLFTEKLRSEALGAVPSPEPPHWQRARQTAADLKLMLPTDLQQDWGGRDEKWLTSESGQRYFITPDGRLFRYEAESNVVQGLVTAIGRMRDDFQVEGTFIAGFGVDSEDGGANPYYNDPALLTAPLFRSVQSGPEVAAQLSAEGGPLWPVDLTDRDLKPVVARRLAWERLTGTLFAPAVPVGFDWTAESFLKVISEQRPDEVREGLPEELDFAIERYVAEIHDGDRTQLKHADNEDQAAAWYAIFDSVRVDPPPRQTCVMVTLTPLGNQNLPYVVGRGVLGGPRGRLLELAAQSGLEPAPVPSAAPPPFNAEVPIGASGRPPLRLGGPPVDNVTIDEEGTITLARLLGYSIVIGFGLSYICFRSFKITLMVFMVGGLSAVLGMAFVGWTGTAVDAILLSMPSLVYVLGLSGAIHVINYYRDEVAAHGRIGAPGRAFRHALLPCSLAAFTTAIGLISLYTSNIVPIRKFGLFSALGVLGTVGVLFAYLPAALETFVPKLKQVPKGSGQIGEGGWLGRFWNAVGDVVVRRYRLVSLASAVLLVFCAVGLFKIRTTVQLLKLFSSESRIIADYAWLETHFGKLVPMELVVRVPQAPQAESGQSMDPAAAEPETLNALERVEAVARIARVVDQAFGQQGLGVVGESMSLATFLPPLPDPSTRDHSPTRYRFEQELASAREELETSDYLRVEQGGPAVGSDLYRISLRVSALSDVDYGQFILQLRKAVEPVLEGYRGDAAITQALQQREKNRRLLVVLGRGRPEPLGEEPIIKTTDTASPAEDVVPPSQIDQQAIFEATVGDLLRNQKRTRALWHDPRDEAFEGKGSAEAWGKQLAKFDVVVLMRDHAEYDIDFIREHAQQVVDLRDVDFERTQPRIVEEIPLPENSGPIEVVYTGVIPVVYKAQRTLLHSLVESIAWAFVLIAIVMAVLLNPGRFPFDWLKPRNFGFGVAAGMVAMVPNVFPVLVVFGLLCHAGVRIDIGTMMTASVAMGVAVDDTIHFLSWFRVNLDSGMSRLDAVRATYRRVGSAMTQTTIVGGLGLFVFALSSFTPTQRFGTLMLLMLLAALVGDLIFFPALLASPLGRLFKARQPVEAAVSELEVAGQKVRNDAAPSSQPPAPHRLRADAAHHRQQSDQA